MRYMKILATGELMPAFVVSGAIHPEHMQQIIEFCLPNLQKGTHFSKDAYTKEEDVQRNSDIHFFEDPALENRMFGFAKAANQALGLDFILDSAEQFQFTAYSGDKKQHYNWHIDGEPHSANIRKWSGGKPPSNLNETVDPGLTGTVRKLSMSLLLNDDYEGGNFNFRWFTDKIDEVSLRLKKGDAIFFPSAIQHKVDPVTKGNRYSVVKWYGGPPVR